MKPLSLILLLTLFLIMSIKSFSQDTIKYSYNPSGSRIERILILDEGGGKGSGDYYGKKEEGKEEDVKSEAFTDQIGKNSILIYPNPTSGTVTVEIKDLEENEGDQIYLIDQTGRILQNLSIVTINNTLDLYNLKPGIYFMVIKLKNGYTKWSIIKE